MAARAGKATGWVAGAVFLALLMAGGAWLLAISPVRDQASTARTEAQSIRDSNELLRTKIDRLRAQFEDIDEYKADLQAMRLQIPTEALLSEYLRDVDELAVANGVTVTILNSDVGQSLVPVTAEPEATAEAEEPAEATDDTAADPADPAAEPAAEPEPPAPAVLEGFVGIPISVTVVGPYEQVVAFVAAIQSGTDRLFLVVTFNGTAQKDQEASGGRPATAVGDLELTVSGVIYVLQSDYVLSFGDAEEPEEPEDPEDPAEPEEPVLPPLPRAVPGKNPLIPVGAPAAS